RNFGVPLAVFVPIGWVAAHGGSDSGPLIKAVTSIHWYEGPDVSIEFGNRPGFNLLPHRKAESIDWILANLDTLSPHLEELCVKIDALKETKRQRHVQRTICKWSELHQLASSGVHIGPHSISHVPISSTSPVRRQFEIAESKRIVEARFGPSPSFAYPY